MKLIKLSLLIAFLTLYGLGCNAQKQTNNLETTKSEVSNMDKPKYEISVFQGGKELGKLIVETFPAEAPLHSANFDSLVVNEFYNETAFHRVIPGFMIQGGDPNSKNFPNDKNRWGMGDPSQKRIPAEFNEGKENWHHKRGTLSMARTNDPNSATSQFFIMHADAPHLDGQYSIFGQVLEGIEVVDIIANTTCGPNNAPVESVTMKIKKLSK
ncbi:MAG: peptidylprolyl isomerase [Bacteroidetes bacterium]|nr:peptidylprolyl isomerase [Bacteroidota bacterium]